MRYCSIDGKISCLPDIIECENLTEWNNYLSQLYKEVFVPDFINTKPLFRGLPVFIRREPRDGIWEHSFTHMTHEDLLHHSSDPNDRIPDLRRSERVNWVRAIIEHDNCSSVKQCGEILYWEEMFRGRVRSNLLFESERFLIVLEKAKKAYFLITSFYIDEDYALEKRRRKYQKYITQKTPLV